jgi:hypothetical protein
MNSIGFLEEETTRLLSGYGAEIQLYERRSSSVKQAGGDETLRRPRRIVYFFL